jgi:hypothetical protein
MTCRSDTAVTAALELARLGYPVFPCRPRRKEPCTRNGLKDATTDTGLIQGWWEQWPDANLAVRTGDGLLVVDIDGETGSKAFHALRDEHADTSSGPVVLTGSGRGMHCWYRVDRPVRSSAGKAATGIDIRCDGGYALVPPSVTTGPYEWHMQLGWFKELPLAPEWLLGRLETRQTPAQRPVGYWRDLTANGACQGARNESCAQLAGHLFARGVDPFVTLELVIAWNRHRNNPPLDDDEVARVVRSIAKRELERWL